MCLAKTPTYIHKTLHLTINSEEDNLVSVGWNSDNGILILAGQGKPGFNQTMFDTDTLIISEQ